MLGRLFNLLRSRPASDAVPADELFIDDHVVGGLEILPASAASWCRQQFQKIAEFAAEHVAPNGAGWTDMYVRPAPPKSVADLKLLWDPAVAALTAALPEIPRVVTGSTASPTLIMRARAFGRTPLDAIVLYRDSKDTTVASIEITLRGERESEREVLAALARLP